MLHVVYRSYGGENAKGRPAYYSKLNALISVVRAMAELGDQGEILFLNDGPIPADRLKVMERSGEILAYKRLGMQRSMRTALTLPAERGWADDDLVWFAEDDYLYLPRAFTDLTAAAAAFPEAAYFTLYGTFGARLPNGETHEDSRLPAGWKESAPKLVAGHRWSRALSTTSTFGGRVGPVNADRSMMLLSMWSGGAWDYTTCLMYQGFQPYPLASLIENLREEQNLGDLSRRAAITVARVGLNGYQAIRTAMGRPARLFVSPDPALSTHLESEFLALGTDWEAVAADTNRWASEQGLV